MKYLNILLIILLSNSHLHSDPLSPFPLLDDINNVLYNKKEKDFKNELGRGIIATIYSKGVVRDKFSHRCGCSLKGSNPNDPNNVQLPEYARFSDDGTNVPLTGDSSLLKKSPNFYNNILLGDSITALGTVISSVGGASYTWNKDYAPGWGIVNGGVGTTIVKANYRDIPGGRTIAATASLLNDYLQKALRGQNVSLTTILDCFSTMQLNGTGFCDKMRGDNSWVSQRLIELNLVMASIANSRGAGMHTLYYTFVDYDALSKGYWYVGNRNFWNMEFDASSTEDYFYQLIQARASNDSIHPNHLGYQAYGATLDIILKHEKANIKQTPFAYKDGCFIEPNDPGPYEECMTKTYHEWVNGKCIDNTPKPPPPIVVQNPNAPNNERPTEVPPPAPTYEPPPRPDVDDNTLLLVAACFFFGACHL